MSFVSVTVNLAVLVIMVLMLVSVIGFVTLLPFVVMVMTLETMRVITLMRMIMAVLMLAMLMLVVVMMFVPVSVIVFSLLCHFLNPQLFLSPLTPKSFTPHFFSAIPSMIFHCSSVTFMIERRELRTRSKFFSFG